MLLLVHSTADYARHAVPGCLRLILEKREKRDRQFSAGEPNSSMSCITWKILVHTIIIQEQNTVHVQ